MTSQWLIGFWFLLHYWISLLKSYYFKNKLLFSVRKFRNLAKISRQNTNVLEFLESLIKIWRKIVFTWPCSIHWRSNMSIRLHVFELSVSVCISSKKMTAFFPKVGPYTDLRLLSICPIKIRWATRASKQVDEFTMMTWWVVLFKRVRR